MTYSHLEMLIRIEERHRVAREMGDTGRDWIDEYRDDVWELMDAVRTLSQANDELMLKLTYANDDAAMAACQIRGLEFVDGQRRALVEATKYALAQYTDDDGSCSQCRDHNPGPQEHLDECPIGRLKRALDSIKTTEEGDDANGLAELQGDQPPTGAVSVTEHRASR